MLRKLITYAVLIALVFWFVSNPAGAASAVHTTAAALSHAGQAIGTFVRGL